MLLPATCAFLAAIGAALWRAPYAPELVFVTLLGLLAAAWRPRRRSQVVDLPGSEPGGLPSLDKSSGDALEATVSESMDVDVGGGSLFDDIAGD